MDLLEPQTPSELDSVNKERSKRTLAVVLAALSLVVMFVMVVGMVTSRPSQVDDITSSNTDSNPNELQKQLEILAQEENVPIPDEEMFAALNVPASTTDEMVENPDELEQQLNLKP